MIPYEVRTKLIVSGRYLEVYDYEIPYYVGFPRLLSNSRFNREKPKPDQEKIREDNVRRSRKKIRRLINCNQDLVKFMTLTFNTPKMSLNETNPLFRQFIKRLNRRYPNFKYLCVPEFQPKSGRVHYHLLCNLPYIVNEELTELWGYGFTFIRQVDSVDNMGAYICKYLTKESFDSRYFGKKKFFYSYNLLRPIIVDKSNEVNKILMNLPERISLLCKKLYEIECFTKYVGMLKYRQFLVHECVKITPD